MRIAMPGGTGQVGRVLHRWLVHHGHRVDVIGRGVADPALRWDGRTQGRWCEAIDGADVVINLAGRSVSCRYHWANLDEMMRSRLDSCEAVGRAIAAARQPPRVWLQASTASIYAHTHHLDQTERDGTFLSVEHHPAYWGYSTHIARAWELALNNADTPRTRRVAMRTGFAMNPDAGSVFDWLAWMVRRGLGGPFYGGQQFVSWIHDHDLARIVDHLIANDRLEGPVNLTAPHPVHNHAFMKTLRDALHTRVALPVLPGMAEVGAWMLHTDVELMRKSRRVLPQKLLESGFVFEHPTWATAAADLADRWSHGRVDLAA